MASAESVDRYPLAWPIGWVRTSHRQAAKFHRRETGQSEHGTWIRNRAMTLSVALDRLEIELQRLGAKDIILSTNLPLGLRGTPMGNVSPDRGDPGAAVYFRHKGKPIVLACDKWTTVADNVAAIAAHIDAIRRMDRYGVGKLEQALAGYTRLLSGRRAWFEVLDFAEPPREWSVIEARYLKLAKLNHPDRPGGNADVMQQINEAYQTARQELGQ